MEYHKYCLHNNKYGKSYLYYTLGLYEEKIDKKKAFEYYKLALEEKDADGYVYNNIGLCYKYGNGCDIDYVKMFYYWNLGLNKGCNGMIYNNMAFCYEKGVGCEKDEKKAFEYYILATNQKDVSKKNFMNLAICYKDGIGCDKNISAYNIYMDIAKQHINPSYELDKVISLYEEIDNLKNTINNLNDKVDKLNEYITELEYSPNPGIKFTEAKKEFEVNKFKYLKF